MIECAIDPDRPFYRMLNPRWTFKPLSGEGAAKRGGRFNRPGVEALYLAFDEQTAIAEYQQDDTLLPPGTLVAHQITVDNIVDFRNGPTDVKWDAIWSKYDCRWKYHAFYENIDPPTWEIFDRVRERGNAGILYPSTRNPDGVALVIYPDLLERAEGKIEVHDPDNRLPVAPSSWKD